jgi:hypothetical protein
MGGWRALLMLCALLAMGDGAFARPRLGLYVGAPPLAPHNIDRRAAWLHRPVDLALDFDVGRGWAPEPYAALDWQLGPWAAWTKARRGRNLLYTLAMTGGGPENTVQACATRSTTDPANPFVVHFKDVADTLARHGLDHAILRIGHEFTGDWYPWSVEGVDRRPNTALAYYADCYRNIVIILRNAQPQALWTFDWNPTPTASPAELDAAYPGAGYVDVVSTDVYDQAWPAYYPPDCDSGCRRASQTRHWAETRARLETIRAFALAHGKRMGLPEWGVVDEAHNGGGDDPVFVRGMRRFIRQSGRTLAYQVYFDVDAPDGAHRLFGEPATFPNASAAFRRGFGGKVKRSRRLGTWANTKGLESPSTSSSPRK